ncbi:MAG: hypothetical protein ACRC4N_09750 [Gammaproteobacteria bacterium]
MVRIDSGQHSDRNKRQLRLIAGDFSHVKEKKRRREGAFLNGTQVNLSFIIRSLTGKSIWR